MPSKIAKVVIQFSGAVCLPPTYGGSLFNCISRYTRASRTPFRALRQPLPHSAAGRYICVIEGGTILQPGGAGRIHDELRQE